MGLTGQIPIKELTSKTCWLIAVCGMLRASDIHRINDNKKVLGSDYVEFTVVAVEATKEFFVTTKSSLHQNGGSLNIKKAKRVLSVHAPSGVQ
ncbi:hypothetical protein BB560_001810 [Smittium megazygosporum]|uniref:Uncharacterized protein n=1 Tax=Smittium megazygosporum TaxID=133381 RepID=A0A2T9ZGI4_9FUNG|nr:hypothetical protein BB560_001810 [Smittium megazygosporum]